MHLSTPQAVTAMAATVLLALSPALVAVPNASAAADTQWGAALEAGLPDGANTTVQSANVNSVSCTSPGNCSAVGEYDDSDGNQQALLLKETDSVWGVGAEGTLPDGFATTDQAAVLNDVACSSAGNCSAAGTYYDGSGNQQPLLVDEIGGTWQDGVEGALPSNAATASLQTNIGSLSCASAGNCAAVGWYRDSDGNEQGLILDQVNGTWHDSAEVELPAGVSATGASGELASVSCTSPGTCSAVGTYNNLTALSANAIVVDEVSGTWHRPSFLGMPSDAATTGAYSSGTAVSCPSTGTCSAVAQFLTTTAQYVDAVLTEKSGTWQTGKEASLPENAATTDAEPDLVALACSAAGTCAAVGSYETGPDVEQGLLIDERGGVWQRGVEAQLPVGAGTEPTVDLNSVSCPTSTMCSAVGSYQDAEPNFDSEPLLLDESAGTWQPAQLQGLPDDVADHPNTSMFSVSCAAAANCAAGGTYVNTSGSGDNQSGLLYDSVATQPTITVHAPAAGKAGSMIAAGSVTATLANGDTPAGSLSVSVFGPRSTPPANCVTGAAATRTVAVSGNAGYHPATGYTPPKSGDYWWYSSYSGDGTDSQAASPCGAAMAKTVVKKPAKPHLTAKPKITGKARKGQKLKAGRGRWTSVEKLTYSYRWERCSSRGKACKAIHGAKSVSYKLKSADIGHRIAVIVTATDADHQQAHATAKPVGPTKH
jgi:hypothetical protein